MTILSDTSIVLALDDDRVNTLRIEGITDRAEQIQAASVDLRMSAEFCGINSGQEEAMRRMQLANKQMTQQEALELLSIDTRAALPESMYDKIEVPEGNSLVMPPQTFLLGSTIEKVSIPANMVGRVEGRSSYARLGLAIHSTAGFIDPGFEGNITLEIYNHSPRPIKLYPGDRVCQIVLEELSTDAERAYGPERGSKYHGQAGPTPSRVHQDNEEA